MSLFTSSVYLSVLCNLSQWQLFTISYAQSSNSNSPIDTGLDWSRPSLVLLNKQRTKGSLPDHQVQSHLPKSGSTVLLHNFCNLSLRFIFPTCKMILKLLYIRIPCYGKRHCQNSKLIQRNSKMKLKNFTRLVVATCLFLFYAFFYACEQILHLVHFTN